jgi:hypothetical protein
LACTNNTMTDNIQDQAKTTSSYDGRPAMAPPDVEQPTEPQIFKPTDDPPAAATERLGEPIKVSQRRAEAKNAKMDQKHHLDSEEEKQEVSETTTSVNRDANMAGRDRRPQHEIEKITRKEEQQRRRERQPRHQYYAKPSPRQPDDEGLSSLVTPGVFAFSEGQGKLERRIKGQITAPITNSDNTEASMMGSDCRPRHLTVKRTRKEEQQRRRERQPRHQRNAKPSPRLL